MSLWDLLKKALGTAPAPTAPAAAEREPFSPDNNEATCAATHASLDRYWAGLGTVEADLLGHLISPGLLGGSNWPSTRQAYRVVRRDGTLILATDGMSDPFDQAQGMGNGYEMELFVETADLPAELAGQPGDISQLPRSWAFELLQHVASSVADAGGITHSLQRLGALSMEMPGFSESHALNGQLPARFVTADDCVGVLLGAPAPGFATRIDDTPLSPVQVVPVVLLTALELEAIRAGGKAARDAIVDGLAASSGHVCSFQRADMV